VESVRQPAGDRAQERHEDEGSEPSDSGLGLGGFALLALDPDEGTDEERGAKVANRGEVESVVRDLISLSSSSVTRTTGADARTDGVHVTSESGGRGALQDAAGAGGRHMQPNVFDHQAYVGCRPRTSGPMAATRRPSGSVEPRGPDVGLRRFRLMVDRAKDAEP